jgi:branched-chain amino acid aminotransferase
MASESLLVFINGRIVPAAEARISVFDAGFTHAAGLFETLRAYNGRFMRPADHFDRLLHSAAALGLQINATRETLQNAVTMVLEANKLKEARLRLLATPGNVPRPGEPGIGPVETVIIATAEPVRPYPADLYRHGMRVCICPYKQSRFNPIAGHKTLDYLPRLLAMRYAAEHKCNESLWFNTENQLAEGSICNVFVVHGDRISTPPLDTPVLPGTVRKTVIELARDNGIALEERPIDINGLLEAGEVFLTGSVLEVMPVTAIEQHQVGEGVPGKIVTRLRELYTTLVAKECGTNG